MAVRPAALPGPQLHRQHQGWQKPALDGRYGALRFDGALLAEGLGALVQGAVFWDWTQDGLDTETSVPVQLQMDAGIFAGAANPCT